MSSSVREQSDVEKEHTRKKGEYKTYRFKTFDPAMKEVLGFTNGTTLTAIAKASGVSSSTIANWRAQKTRRPQNASIEATGRALGKKRVWVDM